MRLRSIIVTMLLSSAAAQAQTIIQAEPQAPESRVIEPAKPADAAPVKPDGSADGAMRFSVTPAGDGVLRVDRITGAVTRCAPRPAGWACEAVPEEKAAFDAEIGRLSESLTTLRNENASLRTQLDETRAQLAARDARPKTPETQARRDDNPQVRLPTQADVDRALAYARKVWRRLLDVAQDLQRGVQEKI